ncbi:MAG TPA: pyridoxamine 5'-phosphate oxidase family protein [Oceanobacillus sp.]|nr:pyridoxamine 5'-phosphate oxidase family protein [Oceanobacillus sp.]
MTGFIPWRTVDLQLQSLRTVWISCTRPDGRPHATPVWFIWDDKQIIFAVSKQSQKARNLKHQPFVVVHAGDGDDAYILEGIAELVSEPAELERLNRLYMEKYVDPNSGARATLNPEQDDIYRVRVQHVMCWLYGTVTNRTDWRFGS